MDLIRGSKTRCRRSSAGLANVNIHAIDPSSLDGQAGGNVFDPHKDFLFCL
jgi:hypothetical protein